MTLVSTYPGDTRSAGIALGAKRCGEATLDPERLPAMQRHRARLFGKLQSTLRGQALQYCFDGISGARSTERFDHRDGSAPFGEDHFAAGLHGPDRLREMLIRLA